MSEQNLPTFVVKRIKFYNIYLLIKYLFIRYEIFIRERRRLFTTEFSIKDIIAEHYIFLMANKKVGIARVIYKNHTAELGRVAILIKHRHQGYGTELIKQIMNIIRHNKKINLITLFTKNERVEFYKKFGFVEDGKRNINNISLARMTVDIMR